MDNLALIASYTYTDAQDPDGDQLVRRPKNVASLVADYSLLDGRANANLTVRYSGDQQDAAFDPITFEQSQVALDSYTVVNLNASYKLNETVEVFGRIENLFDEEYEETLGYGNLERGFYVGLKAAL
jgi:vitamin B12 transporter